METKELNLYKVYMKTWANPTYVAAENHQEAVDKAAISYPDLDKNRFNVDWVGDVTV